MDSLSYHEARLDRTKNVSTTSVPYPMRCAYSKRVRLISDFFAIALAISSLSIELESDSGTMTLDHGELDPQQCQRLEESRHRQRPCDYWIESDPPRQLGGDHVGGLIVPGDEHRRRPSTEIRVGHVLETGSV
jgi:hypothetical protein